MGSETSSSWHFVDESYGLNLELYGPSYSRNWAVVTQPTHSYECTGNSYRSEGERLTLVQYQICPNELFSFATTCHDKKWPGSKQGAACTEDTEQGPWQGTRREPKPSQGCPQGQVGVLGPHSDCCLSFLCFLCFSFSPILHFVTAQITRKIVISYSVFFWTEPPTSVDALSDTNLHFTGKVYCTIWCTVHDTMQYTINNQYSETMPSLPVCSQSAPLLRDMPAGKRSSGILRNLGGRCLFLAGSLFQDLKHPAAHPDRALYGQHPAPHSSCACVLYA